MQIAIEAAQLMNPQAQEAVLPARMLKTDADVDVWIDEVRQQFKAALQNGPIVIH
jgi:hypothetical protein